MANDESTPEWAKNEVKEAIRILKEDGLHVHRTYDAFLASKKVEKGSEAGEKLSETGEKLSGEEEKTEGQPPPEKAKEEQTEKPKKKGMWWGDRSE
jgi:hypothetical protein